MEEKDLFQLLKEVEDEKTFISFIEALTKDRINCDEWQNDSIEDFFECAHAWAIATINGNGTYQKPENPWKRCADIIYMGKIYE